MQAPHPDDQTLKAYGLGKLDDERASTVDDHLERCPDCRQRISGLTSDSFLGRFREVNKPSARSIPDGSMADGTLSFAQAKVTAPPPPADTLPPGLADHPDYEIKRELGRGGMGVVYLAHNTMMGRDEVLKVMSRHLIDRPGVLDRFQREIRAVAKLRHPNIVAAHAAFRIEGGLVFAMEYVEGLDLARLVKAKGPLPVAHAAYFIHQAALGLQHAHEKGLIHRDIKPHNLMLTHEGKSRVVKVLDFGLAKATREQTVDGGLTSEGQALGTPDYIAPEQIVNALDVDIRADIYSLGGTLYYLLTGRPPFQCTSLYDIYQAHMSRDAEPLNLIRPEVPAEMAALVAKMMAKEPKRRFQTPAEVAQALTPFFKSKAVKVQAEPSQVVPSDPKTLVVVEKPARTEPATVAPASSIRPANPKVSSRPKRERPIDLGERELMQEPSSAGEPGRSRWVWPTAALLFVLLIAWLAGIFKVKTEDGVIVLENVPDDAQVLVDGRKITLTWKGDDKPVEIRAVPGEHELEVEKGGFKTFGTKVTFKANGPEVFKVHLEPLVEPPGISKSITPEQGPKESSITAERGFVSVFNGKDISGWKPSAFHKGGTIAVEDDVLVIKTRANQHSVYVSDQTYGDIHVKAEVLNGFGDHGHLVLRTSETAANVGDRVALGGSSVDLPIGSVMAQKPPGIRWGWQKSSLQVPVRPGDWYRIEIIDRTDQVTVMVNGGTVLTKKFPSRRTREPGRLKLYGDPKSELHIRNFKINTISVLSEAAASPSLAEKVPGTSGGKGSTAEKVPGALGSAEVLKDTSPEGIFKSLGLVKPEGGWWVMATEADVLKTYERDVWPALESVKQAFETLAASLQVELELAQALESRNGLDIDSCRERLRSLKPRAELVRDYEDKWEKFYKRSETLEPLVGKVEEQYGALGADPDFKRACGEIRQQTKSYPEFYPSEKFNIMKGKVIKARRAYSPEANGFQPKNKP